LLKQRREFKKMTKEELKKVEQEIKEFLSELEIPITTKTDFDEVFGIINV